MNAINIKKVQNKKDLKRKTILEAAAKVFSEKGYTDSSIKDITNEASVSVGSFYSYFSNKEEVLEQIYEEISYMSLKIANDASALKGNDSVVKKFTSSMTCAILTYADNKELSKILFLKSMGINDTLEKKRWEVLDKTNIYLRELLEHLNNSHSCDIYDINTASVMLTHSIFGAVTYWLDEKLTSDLKAISLSLCTYHLRALGITFNTDEVSNYIDEILTSGYENFLK